jgi:serine/threonine protein phosphatase PrpC
MAEEEFPRQLVRQWRAAVTRHAAEASDPADTPAAPDSVHSAEAAAADAGPPAAEHAMATDVTTPYGATLVGVVVTPGLLVCWQLGDGDIVLVDQGRNASCPLAPEQPRLGVETESLCQPDAWSHVRVHWRPLTGAPPALVLLSTDGLSDSYADRPGFEGFAVDMLDRIQSEGVAAVQEQIVGWLGKAAEFSGDDATVAAAWRVPEGAS